MKRLIIFFLLFFVGLCLTAFVSQGFMLLGEEGSRDVLLMQSVTQSVLAFILPVWLLTVFTNRGEGNVADPGMLSDKNAESHFEKCLDILRLNIPPTWRNVLGVVVVYVVALPAMNQLIYWNQEISLPESLSGIETSLRQMEEIAATTTEKILKVSSIWGLVSGVVVVGIVTGFSEELFFRAGLQQIIRKCGVSADLAVWTAAFIFSALHFQFFGFLPRLLMGVMFGYMFLWSGSIWTSAIAHALNNSLVVITFWFASNGYISESYIETAGVAETGFPMLAIASGIATTFLLVIFRKYLFFTSNSLR